jgi:hypothetical protein
MIADCGLRIAERVPTPRDWVSCKFVQSFFLESEQVNYFNKKDLVFLVFCFAKMGA